MATAAAASPNPVTGTTCNLSVLGADDAGESNLTYTWSTTGTPPAAVNFSANGSNAAKNTTATFSKAGNYSFQVTITDAGGLDGHQQRQRDGQPDAHCDCRGPGVDQSKRRSRTAVHGHGRGPVRGGPGLATHFHLDDHRGDDQRQRAADRAGHAVPSGTVTAGYPLAGGGSVNGTAAFTVTVQPPTVATAASASPNPVTGTTCNLSVLGADDAGESNLTYTWAATGTPPAAVNFSLNGSNAAQNTTATFSKAGNYSFQVTITDPAGLTATSSVNVTVNQTFTAITVAPASINLNDGAVEQFTATAEDQFGQPSPRNRVSPGRRPQGRSAVAGC